MIPAIIASLAFAALLGWLAAWKIQDLRMARWLEHLERDGSRFLHSRHFRKASARDRVYEGPDDHVIDDPTELADHLQHLQGDGSG